jgi:hypothetical protein
MSSQTISTAAVMGNYAEKEKIDLIAIGTVAITISDIYQITTLNLV